MIGNIMNPTPKLSNLSRTPPNPDPITPDELESFTVRALLRIDSIKSPRIVIGIMTIPMRKMSVKVNPKSLNPNTKTISLMTAIEIKTPKNCPNRPSSVFFGEMKYEKLCFPKTLPNTRAVDSVNAI